MMLVLEGGARHPPSTMPSSQWERKDFAPQTPFIADNCDEHYMTSLTSWFNYNLGWSSIRPDPRLCQRHRQGEMSPSAHSFSSTKRTHLLASSAVASQSALDDLSYGKIESLESNCPLLLLRRIQNGIQFAFVELRSHLIQGLLHKLRCRPIRLPSQPPPLR
eukprot:4603167-Amphidinium_carterae.1